MGELPNYHFPLVQLPERQSGDADRPDVGGVPSRDEVLVLQVRPVGHGTDARRALRPAAQRHEREDLRLPLVLVSCV